MGSILERMERQAVLLERDTHRADLDFLIDFEKLEWRNRLRTLAQQGEPEASFLTGTNVELIYSSISAGTAKASFTSEAQINDTTGMGVQAHLPADFWLPAKKEQGRGIRIVARGILSSTGTPTYTFTCRGGTAGSTSAAILLGSAALTTGSGVSNQMWEFQGDVILEAIGAAGANSTARGIGLLASGGLASPFSYPLWGGGAANGTVATLDTSIVNYINFNITCSASNAANTITILHLLVFGLN